MVVQIYVVKKAYNTRNFAVKPSQRRYFAPIFALFFNNSINRRNFVVKPSQRRYFATILRQKNFCAKRAPAPAYRGIYVEFTRIFCSVLDFFAQFLVHFLLGGQGKREIDGRDFSHARFHQPLNKKLSLGLRPKPARAQSRQFRFTYFRPRGDRDDEGKGGGGGGDKHRTEQKSPIDLNAAEE